MIDDSPDTTCSAHPDELAGWRCHGECKARLCPACATQLLQAFTCCACGGTAHRLSVARSTRSTLHWLGVAIRAPFTRGVPLVALALVLLGIVPFATSLVEASPGQLGAVARGAQVAILGAFVLITLDAAARGGAKEAGTLLRLARLLVATTWIWVPALAYVIFVGAPGGAALRDPALLLFAGLALLYLPLVLSIATIDTGFGDVIDPFKVFDLAWRLKRVYARTIVLACALVALAVAVAGPALASAHQTIATPIVRDVIGMLPTLVVLAVLANAIGLVTYVDGHVLGWGAVTAYREPIHPRMTATGKRKPRAATQPIATDGKAPSAPAISAMDKAHLLKLVEAIKTDNLARALRLYEERALPAGAIDDRSLIVLARAAGRARRPELAEQLLEDAHARNGHAAGHALLALAQLYSASQPDRAHETYRKVVALYPDTDVAKVAAKHLEAT